MATRRSSFWVTANPWGQDSLPPDATPKGWDRLVIHPNSQAKNWFDLFIIVCVLYTSVLTPIEVCYKVELLPMVDIALDVIFVFDMLVQFFAGYFDLGGSRFPMLKLHRVVRRYIRTWFAVDLLAGFPVDRFISQLGPIALVKTIRLLKIKRIMEKYENLSWGPTLKVITILFFWLLCAHWVACGFFVQAWLTCSTYSETWVTIYWPDLRQACRDGQSGLAAYGSVSRVLSMHTRVMYWALATMSSMGYGNAPRAVSDGDYIYGIGTQVIGACLAAAIFSHIAQMINVGDASANRYQAQHEKIQEFTRLHKLSEDTASRLQGYSELLFSLNRGLNMHEIAAMFPTNVQEDIYIGLHETMLRKVPLFAHCDNTFLRALVPHLRPQVLLEGDLAYRKGDMGDSMYVLQTGYVQVGNSDLSSVYATLGPETYFGEMALFQERRRRVSVRALHDCIMSTLKAQAFNLVVERNPTMFAQMQMHAEERRSKQQGLIGKYRDSIISFVDDEHDGDASNTDLSQEADAGEALQRSSITPAQALLDHQAREREETLRYTIGLAKLSSEVWDMKVQLMQLLQKASRSSRSNSCTQARLSMPEQRVSSSSCEW